MVTRTCSVQSALQHACRILFLVHVQHVYHVRTWARRIKSERGASDRAARSTARNPKKRSGEDRSRGAGEGEWQQMRPMGAVRAWPARLLVSAREPGARCHGVSYVLALTSFVASAGCG
eukprot:724466-Prymnesium_polylepis.1